MKNSTRDSRSAECGIPDGNLPGLPKHKARCSRCNEMILDNKEVHFDGMVVCGNCAGYSYYTDEA
ncbi:MAG: hypothetical protein LUQ07_00690 [Methanospirillum sp.]|nr:hypothetical protein [Methanospirillum sp.]